MMRAKLTRLLSIRQAPYLKFQIDEGLKKELAVLDLLEKVRQENEELDRAAAPRSRRRAAGSAAEVGHWPTPGVTGTAGLQPEAGT